MLLLSTSSLKGYDLNHIFAICKESGYQGIDLHFSPQLYDTHDLEYLEKISTQHQIPIVSITSSNKITPEQIQLLISLCKTLNCQTLILQNPKTQSPKTATWMKENIPTIQNQQPFKIAIENASTQYFFGIFPKNTITSSEEINTYKHFSLNTTRLGERNQDLFHVFEQVKNQLAHVRISNYNHKQKYTSLETGQLPLENFLIKLKQYDYKGNISIQIAPKYLKAGNSKNVTKNLRNAKKFYDQYFLKVTPPAPDFTANNPSDY